MRYDVLVSLFQNGFWFSIGWCVLFLVPMVISTAILTTYLRKSPEDVHSFVEEGNLGTDGEVISNSQVVTTGYRSQQVRYEHVSVWCIQYMNGVHVL